MELSAKAFVSLLKECARRKDLRQGVRIHGELTQKGLLPNNPYLVSVLITMYARCGRMQRAKKLHGELHGRSTVVWNSLLAGYAASGHGRQAEEALECMESMREAGVSPDVVTFICLLKACGSIACVEKGMQIHMEIVCRGDSDATASSSSSSSSASASASCLATAMVDMYAKCGRLAEARQVHEAMPVRDVVTWSALISGYAHHGRCREAMSCYEEMQRGEGLSPNAITFISILKACGSMGAIEEGIHIHGEIARKRSVEKNAVLGNALVGMYARCGAIERAQQVHDELPNRDAICWSALMNAYARHGRGEEAWRCFERMQIEGVCPDGVILIGGLNASGAIGSICIGRRIHCTILGLARGKEDDDDTVLGASLLDMYAKCGVLDEARQVHDRLRVRNVVSWNALIVGHAEAGQGRIALQCLEQMRIEGLSPDAVTAIGILKACGRIGAAQMGEKLLQDAAEIDADLPSLLDDAALCTAFVDMYAKCGMLAKARGLLDRLTDRRRNVATWSAVISGYAEQGRLREALDCFEQMLSEGIPPNAVTFACMLKACSRAGAVEQGARVHELLSRRGLLGGQNPVLGSALVDMYARCGAVCRARQVHEEELRARDVVSWSALIAGYAQLGRAWEALSCFEQMQGERVRPNAVTFLSVLKACASVGALARGQELHGSILDMGLLGKDVVLGTALVDMYAKCGMLDRALHVLEGLPIRNAFSWSALLSGYARLGLAREALSCFQLMLDEGHSPDHVTFLCVLSACARAGLWNDARACFGTMSASYGIDPHPEHHACVAASLACIGHFGKAMSMIAAMPCLSAYLPAWRALLAACRRWGNVKLASLAFDRALQSSNAGSSSSWRSLYAASAVREDADNVSNIVRWGEEKDSGERETGSVERRPRLVSVGDQFWCDSRSCAKKHSRGT